VSAGVEQIPGGQKIAVKVASSGINTEKLFQIQAGIDSR